MRPLGLILLLFMCLPATQVAAQEDRPDVPLEQMRPMIERDPGNFLAQMIGQLFRAAPDGRLTVEAAATLGQIEVAARRAQLLSQLLAYDLDGDLLLSAAELTTLRGALSGERRAELETLVALADADADHIISTTELLARADAQVGEPGGRSGDLDMLLAFDLDGDGAVTVDELREAVRRVAAGERLDGSCALLSPSAGAEVLLLSGQSGRLLSTIAVAGQDELTTAARIMVEPGSAPLYVVVTSADSVLWVFEGETDRIEHVVAGIDAADVGVVGVSRDRVAFVPVDGCLPRWVAGASEARKLGAARALGEVLHREVDRVVVADAQGDVAIPSGEPRELPASGDLLGELVAKAMARAGEDTSRRAAVESEARDAARFYPGGLLSLDPMVAVAPKAVQAYEVLPQNAGMLQLLAAGALEPMRETYPAAAGEAYRIVRPIPRFPPGLFGAHREEFVLAPNVPMPSGTPGHSGVVDETTGECMTGATCLHP